MLVKDDNWAMKSLHSLSQDLYEEDFNIVAQPEARHLGKLRNAAEHRFLSIHEQAVPQSSDDSQFRIGIEDFEKNDANNET